MSVTAVLFCVRMIVRVNLVIVLVIVVDRVWPTYACGCGVYLPRENDRGDVLQERALVRWDGQTEEIILELDVAGEASEAAWILPLPARAEVKLGDATLFPALYELTKPRVEERRRQAIPGFGEASEGAVGGAQLVTVLGREKLGPFDVSNLAASDATALADWLDENGYTFPPALADVLQPYVEQNWFFVAVRLQPAAADGTLQGALDPLWVTFPATQLVYPIRATALAQATLPVTIYVLADHRTSKTLSFGASRISYADWLDPAALPAESPLHSVVQSRQFLTKFEDVVDPEQVNDDFVFTFAAQDAPYHEVNVRYREDYTLFYALVCGAPLLFGLFLAAGILHYLRQRRATAPTTEPVSQ